MQPLERSEGAVVQSCRQARDGIDNGRGVMARKRRDRPVKDVRGCAAEAKFDCDQKLVGRSAPLTVNYPRGSSSAQQSMSAIPASISTHPHLTREDVLDGRDVAELLHMPISTVLEYARRGLLPGHKLGRRWIFLRDEIEAAVRGRP